MEIISLLAQTSVGEGITWVERIVQGGPAVILAVFVVVVGWFAYRQLNTNGELERGFREKIEELLREMLGRDREAQEATSAAVQVVESFTDALTEQKVASEQTNRAVADCGRVLEDIKRLVESQNATLLSQSERMRALEDEVRRGRNG